MKKGIAKWLDPILLIGLLISALISIVVMGFPGNDPIIGFIIGLLSTIITLLVDLIARLNRVEHNVIETQRLSRVLMSGSISQDLQELARDYELIEAYDFNLYRKIASDSFGECKRRFREIASGTVRILDKSVYHYNIEGIKQARNSIKVTHITSPDYWVSDAGRKFLEASQIALKRGVETVIIFAVSDEDIQNFKNIFDVVRKFKVTVFTTKPKRMDKEFAIIDDTLLLEYAYDKNEDTWITSVILDSKEVTNAVDSFRHFLTYSKPY